MARKSFRRTRNNLDRERSVAGFTADSINTTAKLTLDSVEGGFAITKIHLEMNATVPTLDDEKFQEIAAGAKANCPVSKVLNAEITLTATLK